MKQFRLAAAAAALLFAAPAPFAHAQTTAPGGAAAAPPASDTDHVIPEKEKPTNQVPGVNPNKPLSDQLKKTNGTIRPPGDVDPDMHKPTPNTTHDPIAIPPPGSPGGPTGVQPK